MLMLILSGQFDKMWISSNEQPSKTSVPKLVTLLGMVKEVKPVHPRKESSPMFVTLLGMVMAFRPVHPSKARLPMLVTVLGITVF